METQEQKPTEINSLDDNQNPKTDDSAKKPEDALDEISHDFSKYLRLRKIHGMIQSSIPVLLAFAIGLTIWLCSVGIFWLAGTDYYSLAQSQLEMLPVIVLVLILFLLISFFVGYKRFSRSRLDLRQYIHWCDIEQSFESELLTAFERKNDFVRTDFDEFIEKKAICRIRETGVPQAFTKAEVRRFFAFAAMLLLIAIVFVLLYGIESKIDDSVSKFAFSDDADKSDTHNPKTADADDSASTENQNNKIDKNPINGEPQNPDENENPKPTDPKEKKDTKNENNGSKKPENENPKPENNNQNDESDKPENSDQTDESENTKNANPEDKAKFELDPKKIKPEASEDGESKTKKEKVYHLDKDSNSEGSYVDPEKLLPSIKSLEEGVKSLPLTSQEKELIEKYRNMLEKNLSSR